MQRLAWITDPHLNFLQRPAVDAFCQTVADLSVDGVLLSGDIGEAPNATGYLKLLAGHVACSVYFVLGNHDFYKGSIAGVRRQAAALCEAMPRLVYLNNAGIVALNETTGLLGHDGWADGRLGDYAHSDVMLNDYYLIEELRWIEPEERLKRLNALGDEAASHFRAVLPEALERFSHLIVVTHVPPWREASWHQGQPSNDNWLPHFSCKAVGEALAEAMLAHPDRQITVLCGHTHGEGEAQILPNLKVLTGGAKYGEPRVQRVLDVP